MKAARTNLMATKAPVHLAPPAATAYIGTHGKATPVPRFAPEPASLCGSVVRRARLAGAPLPAGDGGGVRGAAIDAADRAHRRRQDALRLPALADRYPRDAARSGIHTLYVSPLKALTNDIERNLMRPIAEMGLAVTVESRTGDTPQPPSAPASAARRRTSSSPRRKA